MIHEQQYNPVWSGKSVKLLSRTFETSADLATPPNAQEGRGKIKTFPAVQKGIEERKKLVQKQGKTVQ